MAGKPSKKNPMSVNKSDTPLWMRVVIIVVAVSFVASGIAIVAAGIGGGGSSSSDADSGTDSITAEYQPRVDSAMTAMNSSPDNPDIIAQVGHAYFEWAVAVYESGQVSGAIPFWLSAVSYYDKALAIRPDDDIVLGNKAFALYYGQSEAAPSALQAFIDAASDNAELSAQVENARGMLAEYAPSVTATTTP
ncbi:MAG: hypothetical protein JXA36_02835 [Coriobacteriia bacterium]|nr:hypothetical protein [Coriobacteriia bacterium]